MRDLWAICKRSFVSSTILYFYPVVWVLHRVGLTNLSEAQMADLWEKARPFQKNPSDRDSQ